MQEETSLKNKQTYWIKVFKTNFEKKEIPNEVVLKTDFNYQDQYSFLGNNVCKISCTIHISEML